MSELFSVVKWKRGRTKKYVLNYCVFKCKPIDINQYYKNKIELFYNDIIYALIML